MERSTPLASSASHPSRSDRVFLSDTGVDATLLLERLPETVFLVSPQGRVLYVNDCGCRMFGMARESLVGQPLSIPDASGRSTSLVLSLGGQPRPVEVVATPLEMKPGSPIVAVIRDVLQCASLREEILHSLMRDELTGLLNRRGLRYAIEQIQTTRAGDPASYTLLMIDLDHLKFINDRYGHAEGDRAIVQTAQLMRQGLRASDVVARYGGDEFVALLPGVQRRGFEMIRRRLLRVIDQYNDSAQVPYRLALSMGGAFVRDVITVPLELMIAEADDSMYRQKQRRHRQIASQAAVSPSSPIGP